MAPDAGVLATSLDFSCAAYNIGVWVDGSPSSSLPCTAVAFDSTGQPIPGADIRFLAEAGTMKYSAGGDLQYIPLDPNAHHARPELVSDPLVFGDGGSSGCNLPYWTDDTGTTHGQRDGLATLIAYVPGDPAVVAALGLGEPYVDANDNEMFDAVGPEGPEDFVDLNRNGTWDPVQSGPVMLWRQIKVLWTGRPSGTPPVAIVTPPTADIQDGQTATFVFSVVDQNYNGIACYGAQDQIAWTSQAQGAPAITPLSTPTTPAGTGFNLDSNFNFICAGGGAIPGPPEYVSATLTAQCPAGAPSGPGAFTLQGSVACTPFPGGTWVAEGTTALVGGDTECP